MNTENDLIEFGNRVRRRRREIDMTQDELASRIGYTSKGMISKIESGGVNLSMEKVSMIAQALRCKVSDLFPVLTYTKLDRYEEYIIETYRGMDEEEKARLIVYIDAIRHIKKEKPE